MNGPTQAKDASAKVRPISSVPMNPPCPDACIQLRQHAGRDGDFERAQQAQAEDEEDQRDEAVDPGIRAELHDARRTESQRQ